MNWLERLLLKRLCEKLVVQGFYHEQKITEYYKVMYEAAKNEFFEDNKPTLDSFLVECNKTAMEK